MSKNLLIALGLCLTTSVMAQWNLPKTANDSLVSTEILPGDKIALRVYASEAKEVRLTGDFWQLKADFKKDNRGVWEAVVDGLAPGVYRYNFVIDGVRVYDPKSPLASETSALLRVEPTGDEFFAMKEVPHGAIAQRYYYSESLRTTRRLHVWTPAGYEKSTESLPVLYLIHGGGDTDNAWPTVGCAGNILDNLLAEGKIKPMVVVMPNGTIPAETLEGEVPLFSKDLMNDIIPFIERNYRVLTDKDNRALAGLSMGGLETLEVALEHYKQFGYFWVLSSGWFANDQETYREKGAYLRKIAADFNASVRALRFTQGGPEDIAYKNCQAMLKLFDEAGIKYEYSEMPGGHTWHVWRHDLYNMAPQLFK